MNESLLNRTLNTTFENKLSSTGRTLEITFYILLASVTVILNAIIAIAACYIKDKAISTKLSLNLSLSNLIAGIFVIPLHSQGDTWLLTENLCVPVLTGLTLWRSSCVFITTVLVFENYIQMHRHYKSRDEGNGQDNRLCLNLRVTILLLWCSAAAVSLLTLLSTSVTNETLCLSYQHGHKELAYCYYIFIIMLPLFILSCMSVSFKKLSLRFHRCVGAYGTAPRIGLDGDFQYAKCAFRLFYVILSLWVPYLIYIFYITTWDLGTFYFHEPRYKMLKAFQWLSYLSCAVQPVIAIKCNQQLNIIVVQQFCNISGSICGEVEETDSEEMDNTPFEVPTPRPLPNMFRYARTTVDTTNIELNPI